AASHRFSASSTTVAGRRRSIHSRRRSAWSSSAMAQLVGLIVSHDEGFKKHVGQMLRAGAIPISIADDKLARDTASVDLVVVDTRGDAASAMAGIERLRATAQNAGIFAVAEATDPHLIL